MTISISIGNTAAGTIIDVQRMTERLEMMRTQTQKALDQGIGDADKLQAKIDRIDAQIERVNRLSGSEMNLTPERAKLALDRGARELQDGQEFLSRYGEKLDPSGVMGSRLDFWHSKLTGLSESIDTLA